MLVETARLAAQSLGAVVFDVVVPTPASSHPAFLAAVQAEAAAMPRLVGTDVTAGV